MRKIYTIKAFELIFRSDVRGVSNQDILGSWEDDRNKSYKRNLICEKEEARLQIHNNELHHFKFIYSVVKI